MSTPDDKTAPPLPSILADLDQVHTSSEDQIEFNNANDSFHDGSNILKEVQHKTMTGVTSESAADSHCSDDAPNSHDSAVSKNEREKNIEQSVPKNNSTSNVTPGNSTSAATSNPHNHARTTQQSSF